MPKVKEIKHMHELNAKEKAEDVIRDVRMIRESLQKHDCDIDRVLERLQSCENSMKFILTKLK